MTAGCAALISLMDRYLGGLLDPFVSQREVHELMYFMQEAGEPLGLTYVPGHFGPYAENLRQMLQAIEGYYVTGYGTGGDAPDKPLELAPGAVADAGEILAINPETRSRFDRVADLIEGFESLFGLELLATVHWVASREQPSGESELIERVYAWNARKRQFSVEQIELAHRVLADKGWIEARAG